MTQKTKKRLATAAIAFAGVYSVMCAAFFWAMTRPPEQFGRIMAHVPMPAMAVLPFKPLWNIARGGSLQVGDPAPDFELPTYDKSEVVRLSELRGSLPVVLVFGSYT